MDKIFIKIYGTVQGIGYRWFVVEKAKKYNLSGWVKNVEDGTVECAVKGIYKNIEKFIEEIKRQHPFAVIDRMEIRKYQEDIDIEDEFIIKK